jgi:hypothetical protein
MISGSRLRRRGLGTFVPWLTLSLAAIAAGNVLAFVFVAGNPLVSSDGWYFLDAFVRKAVDGTLSFSDLFEKRSQLDHAKPLHKIILLIDLRWFHLDFRLEALAGFAGALGCAFVFFRAIQCSVHPDM